MPDGHVRPGAGSSGNKRRSGTPRWLGRSFAERHAAVGCPAATPLAAASAPAPTPALSSTPSGTCREFMGGILLLPKDPHINNIKSAPHPVSLSLRLSIERRHVESLMLCKGIIVKLKKTSRDFYGCKNKQLIIQYFAKIIQVCRRLVFE